VAGSFISPLDVGVVGARPLSFEPNRGQAPRGTAFLAHGPGYELALSATGAVLTLRSGSTTLARLAPLGADAAVRGQGEQLLPGTTGYASARGSQADLADIPNYARVRYASLYPGVDLIYYGTQQQPEYDFRLRAGANPSQIRLALQGTQRARIAPNGDLVVRTVYGDVREHRPTIYQVIDGVRHTVAGGFVLKGRVIGFQLGAYDHQAPLVIDPTLGFGTYFGGHNDDYGNGIAVDRAGDVYVVGTTT
jgi:hypothetical protein